MAALTGHLHKRVVGTDQVRLQVDVVVQPHSARISFARTQTGKFRMRLVKAADGSSVVRLAVASPQVGVTLSAGCIRRGMQERRALVLDVAGRAFGSERLIGVMDGRIVAREAGFVGHLRGEGSSLSDVTKRALSREYCMSIGELAARIYFLAALRALRDKPGQCNHGNRDGEPETPAPERMRTREILQVNALG